MNHIAIVDDEETLRENLTYVLEKEHFRVSVYNNASDAWIALRKPGADIPDLYVLDIIMPRMNGLEFCRLLRTHNFSIPIIFLSSRDEELDRIQGLETGADDYLGKPFGVRELLARIQAVLRRAGNTEEPGSDEVLTLGPLRVEPGRYSVSWDNKELSMSLSEYRLFSALAMAEGEVKSRSDLYSSAYPDDHYINERAVDSHIKRIRRKLEDRGAPKTILESVYGLGYRLKVREA